MKIKIYRADKFMNNSFLIEDSATEYKIWFDLQRLDLSGNYGEYTY